MVLRGIHLTWVKEHYAGFWDKVERSEWEPHTYREIDRHVGRDTIFVDFGANVGAITLYAAHKAGRVICLEPDPLSLSMLRANISANPDIAGRITVIPKAVHPSGNPIRFGSQHAGGDSMSSSILPGLKTVWTVETLTPAQINALLPARDVPVFVKMDIEGGEYDVIPSGGALWRRANMTLLLSTHQDVLSRFISRKEILVRTWKLFVALRDFELGRVESEHVERRFGLSLLHRCGLAAPLDGTDWLFTQRRPRP